jgi:hypothetical protein
VTKLFKSILVLLVIIAGFLMVDFSGKATDNDLVLENSSLVALQPVEPTMSAPPTEVPTLTVVPERPATVEPGAPPSPTPNPTPLTSARPVHAESPELDKLAPADSLFDSLMTPFANDAERRRAELAKTDPEFAQRVDRELNEGRINFLLFGYGETHEPPATERALIGSHTIISYDLKTRRADIVSLTHDIRAPEIEREMVRTGWKKAPIMRLDHAYEVGGFKLQRQTLEDATGLSIDFQVSFRDAVIQPLVDNVFDGLEVDVPMAFDVHPFYLDGKKYDKGHFTQGTQKLTGRQVIQFIKTVPMTEGAYDPSLEHNVRKALILNALLNEVDQNYRDSLFWLKGSGFVTSQLLSGGIAYDFDPVSLIINNIGTTTASLRRSLAQKSTGGMQLPKMDKSLYIVDPAQGDGGVQWVGANAAVNPITKKDIDDGLYESTDVEVPYDSDPYGNLVTGYWPSVRGIVKKALLGTKP